MELAASYSDTEQYVYGLEAGRILRKIHSIPAPATQEDWEIRFNRKMDYKIKKYVECPIKYENGQAFIDYINENRHLMERERMVASSRVKPGSGMAANSSSTKRT